MRLPDRRLRPAHLFDKVASTYEANISTFSLRLPIWPLFAMAWLGDAAAVLLIGVRTYRWTRWP